MLSESVVCLVSVRLSVRSLPALLCRSSVRTTPRLMSAACMMTEALSCAEPYHSAHCCQGHLGFTLLQGSTASALHARLGHPARMLPRRYWHASAWSRLLSSTRGTSHGCTRSRPMRRRQAVFPVQAVVLFPVMIRLDCLLSLPQPLYNVFVVLCSTSIACRLH